MKLCMLGGGSFRTPHVWQAILSDPRWSRLDQVTLFDVDADRVHTMERILNEMASSSVDSPRLSVSSDLREALAESDFVFAALRVGGLRGRQDDEHIALDLDVLGQETTGPGGIAYALRTIPVMRRVAMAMREVAPAAYLINFTNPAGIITESLYDILGDRVLGICDTPAELGRRVARILDVDHATAELDYVGLNHLGWLRRFLVDGVDLLPSLIADDHALGRLEESAIFGTEWIRSMGVIPNEYLYYYYYNRDAVRSITASDATRGDYLSETQTRFFESAARSENPAALWADVSMRRSASYMAEAKGGGHHAGPSGDEPPEMGYAGVALSVMSAISRNERTSMILNVANKGTIRGLPDDAIVEIPAMVDANGLHPLSTTPPDLHQTGLMQQVKAVERLTIEAAVTGSRKAALSAFALHPLVDSVSVARKLLEAYESRNPDLFSQLTE